MLKMKFYKHLDWLGRIVIPKDIREYIELQEGNKVEIYLNENNEIIIRKVIENDYSYDS